MVFVVDVAPGLGWGVYFCNVGLVSGGIFFWEACHSPIGQASNPPGRQVVSILDRNCEVGGAVLVVSFVSLRLCFSWLHAFDLFV